MCFAQNELTFRATFKKLDGVTTRPQNSSGPLGKKCKENVYSKLQIAFESIENALQHSVKKEDFSYLSTDQRLLYEYTKGIGLEKVGKKYSSWKIGQLHHARRLTLAIRLLAVYTREESPSGNLIKLVHYIVKVYASSWFEIKSLSKLHESPKILFQNLSRIVQLSYEDLKTIAKQMCKETPFAFPRKFSVCVDKR